MSLGWAWLATAALAVACASSSAPEPEAAPTAVPRERQERQPEATPASPPSVVIQSLELKEGAPEALLDLTASGPLVWTSYRNSAGDLVVELPNSEPGPAVADLRPSQGLVASVRVEEDSSGSRPLTRLTLATRSEVEHSLSAEGNVLRLALMPVDVAMEQEPEEEEVALSYEPLPEEEEAQVAQAPPPAPQPRPEDFGTPESPRLSPPPRGAAATQLWEVELLPGGGVRVAGDGEFLYSTFRLENPERFVLDLNGVVNTAPRSVVPVEGEYVSRVRVAQFKPFPEPVSRVVFDLRQTGVPTIERSADGLVVTFGETGAAPARMAQAEPAGAPEEESSMRVTVPPRQEPESGMAGESQMAEAEPMEMEPEPMEAEPTQMAQAPAYEDEPPLEEERVVPPPGPATSDVSLFEAAQVMEESPTQESEFTPQTFGAQTIEGAPKRYVGEPVTLSMRDADLVETLRSFAAISGLSIVVQPEVEGAVTVELVNVPWDQALEQILKINGLGYELEGTIMRIAPVEMLEAEAAQAQKLAEAKALAVPLSTVMRRLSYSDAREISQLLQSRGGLLSRRGSVIVDRRTNTLIIQELPAFMDTIIAVVDELDTPEPQVMIEARIIETTKRFTRSLGVSWSFNGEASAELGTTTGLQFPNNGDVNGGVNLLTGSANGFFGLSLGNVTNAFNLDLALQAAETEGLIKILSAPKVATLNNERASIQSGLQIPVQTIANNTVTVQFVNATLSLDVIPHVTAEGTVLMDINIRKREPQLAFAVVGATNAPIATKEARTRVIVRDGGTTVIGGIYEVTTDQGEDRVPGLANIPIIGHLFRNKRRTDENEELLIFITPRVVNL